MQNKPTDANVFALSLTITDLNSTTKTKQKKKHFFSEKTIKFRTYILYIRGLQERSGIAWARLGAWRALKFTDDSGVWVCPMCRNFEDEFHILGSCKNLECWRNSILPESFLNSERGNLECRKLMVNPDDWLNEGRFLDKVRIIRTLLFDRLAIIEKALLVCNVIIFSSIMFICLRIFYVFVTFMLCIYFFL